MKFQSPKTVWFTIKKIHEQIVGTFSIDVQNVKYIPSDTYFYPNSIKIKKWTVSKVTNTEEPLI